MNDWPIDEAGRGETTWGVCSATGLSCRLPGPPSTSEAPIRYTRSIANPFHRLPRFILVGLTQTRLHCCGILYILLSPSFASQAKLIYGTLMHAAIECGSTVRSWLIVCAAVWLSDHKKQREIFRTVIKYAQTGEHSHIGGSVDVQMTYSLRSENKMQLSLLDESNNLNLIKFI